MENPFVNLKERDLAEQEKQGEEQVRQLVEVQRRQKRDAIYQVYSPMVNEILDRLIDAYQPGIWRQGSDSSHEYCCHINWYAGPEETRRASYDEHHEIRRHVEVTLELDESCNPTGFKIMNHEKMHKCVHVGLSRGELIRGIQEVFA